MAVAEDGRLLRVDVKEMVGPRHPLIVFVGVAGVGKTEQARKFSSRFGFRRLDEDEAARTNPFLGQSYDDLGKAMQSQLLSQLYFLKFKARRYSEAVRLCLSQPVLIEPAIEVDICYAQERLQGRHLEVYLSHVDQIYPELMMPDVYVYLRASFPVTMERIRQRAKLAPPEEAAFRKKETDVPEEYWKGLYRRIDSWYEENRDKRPIVLVDTTKSSIDNTPWEITSKLAPFLDRRAEGLIVPEGLRMRT